MCSLEYFKQKPLIKLLCVVALFLVSKYLQADYYSLGYVFILLMYGLRNERIVRCIAAPFIMPMKVMAFLSLSLTLLYNGKEGVSK